MQTTSHLATAVRRGQLTIRQARQLADAASRRQASDVPAAGRFTSSLVEATVRRANRDAFLRSLELSDIRNLSLGVGPGANAFTTAALVRSIRPGTPDALAERLARLCDETRRPGSTVAPRGDAETMSAPEMVTEDATAYRREAAKGRRPNGPLRHYQQ